MAGNILTPNTIWNNFKIEGEIAFERVNEKISGDIHLTEMYLDGRKLSDGTVKIFGVLAKNVQVSIGPAILLLQDLNSGVNENLIIDLAKRGYTVLSVDLAGYNQGKENFTVYPDSIEYAHYENSKDNLYTVEKNASRTCWYEWDVVARYALKYLSDLPYVSKVGGLGIGESATVMWHVAGTDRLLDCAVFAMNAGWAGYRGILKFSGEKEPQFTDNMYKFIAGIDAQSYAMHVKCPTLLLGATNSDKYDLDRLSDTVSRIDENCYGAVNYSIGYMHRVSGTAYRTALIFFEEFLMRCPEVTSLPQTVDIKCDIIDGKIVVEAIANTDDIKDFFLFVAEQQVTPSVRCWQKINGKKQADGKYIFNYSPYPTSGIVVMFAQAYYKNGYVVGSNVIAKRFKEDEVSPVHKTNIIYSSRFANSESIFSGAKQSDANSDTVNITDGRRIVVKKGPMGISGVTCEWGLLSFNVGTLRFKPGEDSMLMFDVYTKKQSTLTVKLIADYFGSKTEYLVRVNVFGGDVWHNVQLEKNRFKTAEGMVLKSYEKIDAIEFSVDEGEFLLNNALWV